jgi:hypothetical protein
MSVKVLVFFFSRFSLTMATSSVVKIIATSNRVIHVHTLIVAMTACRLVENITAWRERKAKALNPREVSNMLHIYICICMYVCMYVCIRMCVYVCMYSYICVYMHVCVCVCKAKALNPREVTNMFYIYIYIYIYMYVCMYL